MRTKAQEIIKLSGGEELTLDRALYLGKVKLMEIDNFPHKPRYIAREVDGDHFWDVGKTLFESRRGTKFSGGDMDRVSECARYNSDRSSGAPRVGPQFFSKGTSTMSNVISLLDARVQKLLGERRFCYAVPEDSYVRGEGYRVSIVIENESGHFPTGVWPYQPGHGVTRPWFWGGDSHAEAQRLCNEENAKLGLNELESDLIIASSMR